jgi:hypothetical protein
MISLHMMNQVFFHDILVNSFPQFISTIQEVINIYFKHASPLKPNIIFYTYLENHYDVVKSITYCCFNNQLLK